jgi:hypothetical protein
MVSSTGRQRLATLRRVVYFRKDSQTFKEAAIMGGNIPKITPIDYAVNIDMHHIGNGLVNGSTEISLKIILGMGQKNNWEVKWAGVVDEPSGDSEAFPHQAQHADQPESSLNPNLKANSTHAHVRPNSIRSNASKPGPNPTQVWKPRVNASQLL